MTPAAEREFEDRRQCREDGVTDHRLDAIGAAGNKAGKAAGPPFEMIAERELVNVDEDAEREPSHRVLADLGK